MKNKRVFDKNIISTLILIVFLSVCFTVAAIRVNILTKNSCFDTLDDAATQVADDILRHVNSDKEQLEVMADLLSQHDDLDSDIAMKHLSAFRQKESLAIVGILFPDNHLVLGSGDEKQFDISLDYNEELTKLPYISGVISSSDNAEKKYVYYAIPIEKDQKTIGILYGFVDLDDFADSIQVTAFGGNAQVYVADGNTGDFLVDTWHDTLGNVFNEGISGRKVKRGYDYQEMKEDFAKGKSGNIAFWSDTAKEYFYSYYRPVGVNQWMVQLSVPESIAFNNADNIRMVLCLIAIAEVISLLLYFLWVISNVRRSTARKEKQLAQSKYMYDVQKTLFDAHKDLSLITSALDEVEAMLSAKKAFLLEMDGADVTEVFSSHSSIDDTDESLKKYSMSQTFPQLCRNLSSGHDLILYAKEIENLQSEKERAILAEYNVESLMLVPVLDSSDRLIGILGTANMKKRWPDCELLRCVSGNFMMALNNVNSYRQIERMGIIDELTGLRNRNCYENSLIKYEKDNVHSLCCLYMDANGLHELNNTLGHEAGDEMLSYVGTSLRKIFGSHDSYRIGGDEFVVFCVNKSENEVDDNIRLLNERMETREYHLSVGKAWLNDSADIKTMIASAESKMYEEKKLYYEHNGNVSKARTMNQKLEQILLEKKNADAFIGIISARFMGVYVVDINTDIARAIYKPSYFSEILEKNEYHFMPSMRSYIDIYVDDDYCVKFKELLDYDKIHRELSNQSNQVIQYHYKKKDGTRLILGIYAIKDTTGDSGKFSTVWLFEQDYS